MISVIVCSRMSDLFDNLNDNIRNTIGEIDFEVIRIDNSENRWSIAQAYNIGIKKAKFDVLCFVHEDVEFITADWGSTLIELFATGEDIGVIGIAGSKVIYDCPMGWWDVPLNKQCKNILQFDGIHFTHENQGFESGDVQNVALLDGVFLTFTKANNLKFDDSLVNFHGYDTSLCIKSMVLGLKNIAVNLIDIKHLSAGNTDGAWLKSVFKIYNQYRSTLSLLNKESDISKSDLTHYWLKFLHKCVDHKEFKLALQVWVTFFLKKPFTINHFIILRRIILSK